MLQQIEIPVDDVYLHGHLIAPPSPLGWIIFAHGSGSSRFSPRNNQVARSLTRDGLGALLFDLLTEEEDLIFENRFDIDLLAHRLKRLTLWFQASPLSQSLPLAYFGASTGAAAALIAAAQLTNVTALTSIVSRGGRPDLARMENLMMVKCPTLLIVGARDDDVIKLNQEAMKFLPRSQLVLIPGATHLFEEPGTLEEVTKLASDWFLGHLKSISHKESRI